MEKLITYVRLDAHKNTIVVAVAESSVRKEVRDYGTIANTPAVFKKLIAKLASCGEVIGTPKGVHEIKPIRSHAATVRRPDSAQREHVPIREISRQTGVSRNTIRKYLRSDVIELQFQLPDRLSKLDPFAGKLSAWLRREAATRYRANR